MARTIKRSDGLYQKNITLGRNPDGSYIRRTIYAKTQKELERKAAELVQQVSHGMCVAEDKTTFAALSEMWRQQFHPNMTERWRERQTGVLNNHLLPTLGHIKVRDLKPYYLQDIINQMAQKGFATSSMKKVKQAAAQIVEIAYEHDIVPRNVFAKVKVPSIEPNERRALTEEEKELLTRTWQGHRMGLGAMIMLYCGLRRGEMLALRWEDIDFHKKSALFPYVPGLPRRLPCRACAQSQLQAVPAPYRRVKDLRNLKTGQTDRSHRTSPDSSRHKSHCPVLYKPGFCYPPEVVPGSRPSNRRPLPQFHNFRISGSIRSAPSSTAFRRGLSILPQC